jgi:hypothetical protein
VTSLVLIAILLQQPNLEQQARAALDKADLALTEARAEYAKHDLEKTKAAIAEMQVDVELAQKSLADTGKDARRRPKHFKYGEVKSRDMLKRIAALEHDMDLEDREMLAAAKAKVQEVHDAWLLGIMGAKP